VAKFDQPLAAKRAQRLAYGRTADTESLRQLTQGRQAFARLKHTLFN
jgi:hypothetical protein